ncbi:unnamed protein product [Lactuca saligna]|uniref:Uncharacterized protein n=1 Tax=Lactuca saligna TaxID=75948 RepID=A0AA36EDP3_LACSI|nr:unnamed protein product [Lactuca saligna]
MLLPNLPSILDGTDCIKIGELTSIIMKMVGFQSIIRRNPRRQGNLELLLRGSRSLNSIFSPIKAEVLPHWAISYITFHSSLTVPTCYHTRKKIEADDGKLIVINIYFINYKAYNLIQLLTPNSIHIQINDIQSLFQYLLIVIVSK